MTYSVRIGDEKEPPSTHKYYDFERFEEAEAFARLYKVENTIQVKL